MVRRGSIRPRWQLYGSSAVLNLKFLHELAATNGRNFKFTALVATMTLRMERHV
jgi:hypothetical protein